MLKRRRRVLWLPDGNDLKLKLRDSLRGRDPGWRLAVDCPNCDGVNKTGVGVLQLWGQVRAPAGHPPRFRYYGPLELSIMLPVPHNLTV